MGTLIGCYHDPELSVWCDELPGILPVLVELASAQGWGGSDMEWAWCDGPEMPGWRRHLSRPDPFATCTCPLCRSLVRFRRLPTPFVSRSQGASTFLAIAGQCPGCSIIWWW
jgi:hypothetical protein